MRELRTQCKRISINPPGYRLRPELGDNIRSYALRHYVIFFETAPDAVLVVRILHGARDIQAIFNVDEL